jgi:putative nucleotidyltransferase with HDIG domain
MIVGQIKLSQAKISLDELAVHVEKAILEQVATARFDLPAMPRVAGRAFALLRKPDFDIGEVADLIETDPMVAARLVHLANSVAYATVAKVDSVRACVARLGARELTFFLMEIAARQLIDCNNPRIARICDGLWEHSLSVAILSRDLAGALRGLDGEAAYLAGLLHDIGRPILAGMLLDAETRLLGKRVERWILPSKWLEIVLRCERRVGLAVAGAWNLPTSVGDAIEACDQFEPARPSRLANVVWLANALAAATGHDVICKPSKQLTALVAEGAALLGLDEDVISAAAAALPALLAARMG